MALTLDLFQGIVPFVRVAEERSFVRAAASLGVTTAAVSKAVRRLEEDLGVRLLERTSRSVALTREGEELFARGREAVLGVQGARAAVLGARREPRGTVEVSLPPILASFVVPGLVGLSARYPRLSYRVRVTDRLARLATEGIDVAIRMGELEDSSHVARLLRRTRWVTVASPGYLARHPAPRRPADLADHNALVFLGPNGRPRAYTFEIDGARETLDVAGNLTIDHGGELLVAAESGLGVAQVLDFMVAGALAAGRLSEVLPRYAAEGPAIHALSPVARAGSAPVRAFLRFLVEAFGGRA